MRGFFYRGPTPKEPMAPLWAQDRGTAIFVGLSGQRMFNLVYGIPFPKGPRWAKKPEDLNRENTTVTAISFRMYQELVGRRRAWLEVAEDLASFLHVPFLRSYLRKKIDALCPPDEAFEKYDRDAQPPVTSFAQWQVS